MSARAPAAARVLILADTHGQVEPRIVALVDGCDWVIHAGDIGGGALLRQLTPPRGRLLAVRGNNDLPQHWPAGEAKLLAGLPDRALLPLPGGLLALEHGHLVRPARDRHPILRRRYPQARALVYGHSHRLCIDQEDTPWVLNPGAAGGIRTFGGASCLLLQAGEWDWSLQVVRFPT